MSAPELRATVSLAAIFALRMLGLFMIMPVFSVCAKTIPDGDTLLLVGIALGAYGVTQSLLYMEDLSARHGPCVRHEGAGHHRRREAGQDEGRARFCNWSFPDRPAFARLACAYTCHRVGRAVRALSGFNILEASQPSLVSKLAPGNRTDAATGVYNTTQLIGLALGGVAGGWMEPAGK